MTYEFYINGVKIPPVRDEFVSITPTEVETITLANGSELVLPKKPKLIEISFSIHIKNTVLDAYRDLLDFLAIRQKPFELVVNRGIGVVGDAYDVVFSEPTRYTESGENGNIIKIDVGFKQYKAPVVKTIRIVKSSSGAANQGIIKKEREDTRVQEKTFVSRGMDGDNLPSIGALYVPSVPGANVMDHLKKLNPQIWSKYGIRNLPEGTVVKLTE